MLKRLAIWAKFFGVLLVLFTLDAVLIFAPAFAPIPRQGTKSSAQEGAYVQCNGQDNKRSCPGPTLVNGKVQAISQEKDVRQIRPDDKQNEIAIMSLPEISVSSDYKGWVKRWYDWGPWAFNFGLVIVGAFQIWLLWLTWQQIKRQANISATQAAHMESQTEILGSSVAAAQTSADAALGQIRIQESGMSQWVDVESLGCYIQEPPAGRARDFPLTINLRFEAVNNTSHTFDIRKIVTKISMWPSEEEVFTVETNVTLAPDKESRSKRYPFYIPTQSITEEEFKQGTIVTINGEITFKSCLGKMQTDYFGGVYRCGQIDAGQQGIFSHLETLGIVPDRAEEKRHPN